MPGWTALATGEPGEPARLLEAERPDLVLLDVVLPGADGIELMRRTAELAELPVIFISGYGNDETIAKALELGPPTTSSSRSRRPSSWPGSARR